MNFLTLKLFNTNQKHYLTLIFFNTIIYKFFNTKIL